MATDSENKILASDNKGRIIGLKYDEEDIPTIVRYKIQEKII